MRQVEDWFRVTRVDDRLTVVTEPHVHPFLQANIWHLRGSERDLVVDSGLGVASLRTALPWLFERDPVLVVTHAHLDHLGGAHEFATCRTHPAEHAASPVPGTLRGPALAAALGFGVPAPYDLPDLLLDAAPRAGYDPDTYVLRPPRVDLPIEDGDVVDLGDLVLTALHLPGHSPGSIALYEPGERMLFSGDVVYDLEDGEELLDGITGADVDAYAASLTRLADLPLDVVRPGHGESLRRPRLLAIVEDYVRSRRPGARNGPPGT